MMAHTLIPTVERLRQKDCCEASLSYRPAWMTWNPVSKNRHKTKNICRFVLSSHLINFFTSSLFQKTQWNRASVSRSIFQAENRSTHLKFWCLLQAQCPCCMSQVLILFVYTDLWFVLTDGEKSLGISWKPQGGRLARPREWQNPRRRPHSPSVITFRLDLVCSCLCAVACSVQWLKSWWTLDAEGLGAWVSACFSFSDLLFFWREVF